MSPNNSPSTLRGGREIGRADVQELRKDLAHYSAQMGLVLAPGEAGRYARSEASAFLGRVEGERGR